MREFYEHSGQASHTDAAILGELPDTMQRQLAILANRKLFINMRVFHERDSWSLVPPCPV